MCVTESTWDKLWMWEIEVITLQVAFSHTKSATVSTLVETWHTGVWWGIKFLILMLYLRARSEKKNLQTGGRPVFLIPFSLSLSLSLNLNDKVTAIHWIEFVFFKEKRLNNQTNNHILLFFPSAKDSRVLKKSPFKNEEMLTWFRNYVCPAWCSKSA